MKAAVLAESPADEEALWVLVGGLLGVSPKRIGGPRLRSRGWPAVKQQLGTVVRHLHYQTDAELLVVVVDADDELLTVSEGATHHARLRDLRLVRDGTLATLSARPSRSTLRVAVGLAVPCIEAWYLHGEHDHAREAAFAQRTWPLEGRTLRNELKRLVYGTDRPDLRLETERAVSAAKRLAQDLDGLRAAFPFGFGALADDLLAVA